MKTRLSVFLFLQVLASAALGGDKLKEASIEADRSNRPILIKFHAVWCKPCHKMEETTFADDEVKSLLAHDYVVVDVDVDQENEIAEQYRVQSFPTQIVIDPELRPLLVNNGRAEVSEFVMFLKNGRRRHEDVRVAKEYAVGTPVAIEGFSPVSLKMKKRWVRGKGHVTYEHKGMIFRFANFDEKQAFENNADHFVPEFQGCDPVIAVEEHRPQLGDVKFAAFYDDKTYLFASEKHRQMFKKDPKKYLKAPVKVFITEEEISAQAAEILPRTAGQKS